MYSFRTKGFGQTKDAQFNIFLLKTKVNKTKLQQLCDNLGFEDLRVVDPEGHSGGLFLLWREKGTCSSNQFSKIFY